MRVRNKMASVAVAFAFCWLGAASAPYGIARAGDAREDRINNESPDRQADAQVGDSGRDSTDSTTSSDALTSGGGAQIGGHWSGGITDGGLGAGTLDLLINQHHRAKLSGGFDLSFASSQDFVGSLKGTSNKSGVSLTLTPNKQHNCRVALSPTMVSNTEIKGNYSTTKCSGLTNGNFDVTFEHP